MNSSSTPGEDRRASLLSERFFVRSLQRFEAFFSSSRWVKLGGVSLVAAGIVFLALLCVSLYLTFSYLPSSRVYPGGLQEILANAINFLWPLGEFFVFFGLVGIYSLLSEKTLRLRAMFAIGLILAGFPVMFWFQIFLREWLFASPGLYHPSSGFLESEAYLFLANYGSSIGIVLVGVVALRAQGLGVSRFLPLIVGILSSPLVGSIIFRIYFDGDPAAQSGAVETEMWINALIAAPITFSGLAWITVGVSMFGAKDREARILSKERRDTKARNLGLARRLYEEAWREEKLSVVDEISADDFFDRRRNRKGASSLKEAISDLHHAFPDLEAEISEQTAEGDRVFTNVSFSGRDEGGVLYYPPTNKAAAFTGTFTDRFDDYGRLVEHDGRVDEGSLMRQLGHPSDERD